VREHNIPPFTTGEDDGRMRQGGLALFGWSFGTSVVLDVLATADQISAATRESLKPYLRCVDSIGAWLSFMHYLH
jgi:hypothetical protein